MEITNFPSLSQSADVAVMDYHYCVAEVNATGVGIEVLTMDGIVIILSGGTLAAAFFYHLP